MAWSASQVIPTMGATPSYQDLPLHVNSAFSASLGATDWTKASEPDLARACAKHDEAAFSELVRRYEGILLRSAHRLVGSYDEARDATQHTLIQAYLALPGLRVDLSIRPWLFRILRNRCLDLRRRKEAVPFSQLEASSSHDGEDSGSVPVDAPDRRPLPDELAEQADLQQTVHQAVSALPRRYRIVVTLRYQDGLSFAEIGARLNVPEPTARTLFQRAKGRLRQHLVDCF